MVGEILAGELVAHPRPAAPHAVASTSLGAVLNVRFQQGMNGPGGWWILFEPELSLGVDPLYDPVVPDIAGWRVEAMPEAPLAAQFTIVPQWVCEVLSPSTRRRDLSLKLPFYQRAGVEHIWFIDPDAHMVQVFEISPEVAKLIAVRSGNERIIAPPFDAVEIDLSNLWPGFIDDEKSAAEDPEDGDSMPEDS